MPDFHTVKIAKVAKGLSRLRLNRPDKLNAIKSTMPGDIHKRHTEQFMSPWHCTKHTITKVHGQAVSALRVKMVQAPGPVL